MNNAKNPNNPGCANNLHLLGSNLEVLQKMLAMLEEQRPYLRLEKRAVVRSGRVDAGCDEEEKNANRATDRTRMKHGKRNANEAPILKCSHGLTMCNATRSLYNWQSEFRRPVLFFRVSSVSFRGRGILR